MKQVLISELKVGDKLYRISNTDGKLLTYTVKKIENSWYSLSNETGYICASIHCIDTSKNNINEDFYTHPFMAVWMAVRKIRDEQHRLEQKRKQIIKANNVKVKIRYGFSDKHWWTKIINIFKKVKYYGFI